MTTNEIKDFIVNTLLNEPEWEAHFLHQMVDDNGEPDDKANNALLNKKNWKRHRKFKFNSHRDFVIKQQGFTPDANVTLSEDEIWLSDVNPYVGYPEDNKEYICREFISSSEENGCLDVSMCVITDADDKNIVSVTATSD